jgi:hypothetical protein
MATPAAQAPADAGTSARQLAIRTAVLLAPFAVIGVLLVHFYPDSYQQDGGNHFLMARWALVHPHLLVDVWGRPLFTVLYALPAQLGYPAAKLLTLAISLAVAWNTVQLARAHGLERAELTAPLLFVQPSFLLLSSETLTEPLFALVLVIALRLHRAGRYGASMWVAGLLPLARPEGFFVAVLWGAVVAFDPRAGKKLLPRLLSTAPLAGGTVAWSLAAWGIAGDPLYILHDWAWGVHQTFGKGRLLEYWYVRHQLLAGVVLEVLFVLGLFLLVASRRALLPLATLGLLVVLHSALFRLGLFGAAGYARYLVCVAPAMAMATLAGWNQVARWAQRVPRPLVLAAGATVIVWSAWSCLRYVDRWESSRDYRAVDDMYVWFQAHPRPVKRFVFSQFYMGARFERDPAERLLAWQDAEANRQSLRAMPSGTLVLWDAHIGPEFFSIGPADIEGAGYTLLRDASYDLQPLLHHPRKPPPYRQELWMYYKE